MLSSARKSRILAPPHDRSLPLTWLLGGILAAIIAGVLVYGPAVDGPFVFDDNVLPFAQIGSVDPLSHWITGVRPILMFTYWVNHRTSGADPFGYHALNILIHVANTSMVFAMLLRLLSLAGWKLSASWPAALAGSAAFLVHPLATESVSYIAGRSESLAAFFMLSAYLVFLYRPQPAISWQRSVAVLALFAGAVATKENAVALAGILVLTDLFWPAPGSRESLRRNWRLYALMLPGIAAAVAGVWRVIANAPSAGFSVRDFTWYQYGFTQVRAIFQYVRLAVLPLGQSVDHDFPISRTITAHGSLVYLILLVTVVALCIRFRRRFPLACFGFLFFLTLLLPTSSIIPILDPLVERRTYLPLAGLILVACEFVPRLRWPGRLAYWVAAVLLAYTALCHARNQMWGQPERLWIAAAKQSRSNARPYWNLAEYMVRGKRCQAAIPYLQRGEKLMPKEYGIQAGWAIVLDCMGRKEEAVKRLEHAASLQPSSLVFQLLGLLYGSMGRLNDSGAALQKAVQLDPNSAYAHSALALWYESMRNRIAAEHEYRETLQLDRHNREAQVGLLRIQRQTIEEGTAP